MSRWLYKLQVFQGYSEAPVRIMALLSSRYGLVFSQEGEEELSPTLK